jgi:transcriptional regulator with XRE-family HTH domain
MHPKGLPKNSKRKIEMKGFPARLKWAMEERGENQLTLSEKVGVSQPQIYHYLIRKSTPRPLVRQRLAYELKIGYSWLIWGEGGSKVEMKRYPVEEFWFSFSERLIFALWNNGYNAPEFSKELKISSTTVQFWLEGERNPKKEFIPLICQLLNIEPDWLLQKYE